jgi:RecA/RadA recombinase
MAKKDSTPKVTSQADIRKKFQSFIKGNKSQNEYEMFNEAKLPDVDTWISTGCYALNRIMSGSYRKAIAHSRITGFMGMPGVGKSYICGNIMREAQKLGYGVILYETETAIDTEFYARLGVDVESILYQSAMTINQWKTDIVNLLTKLHEEDPEQKWLVVTDSLANLLTEKEIADTEEGGTAQDMGLRAKQYSAASRILQKTIANCNAAMVLTNHSYEKPGANPNVPPVEVPKGGNGFIYMCSTLVGIKKYAIKEDAKTLEDNKSFKEKVANRIVFETVKNRFVPEGMKAEALLHFKHGLQPYHGLLEDALKFGFFEKSARGFFVKHLDKNVFAKDLYTAEVWEPIFDELQKKVEAAMAYSSYGEDGTAIIPDESEENGTPKGKDE